MAANRLRFWLRRFLNRPLSDAELLRRSLWDEVDGEPMNKYAEEYMRRHLETTDGC